MNASSPSSDSPTLPSDTNNDALSNSTGGWRNTNFARYCDEGSRLDTRLPRKSKTPRNSALTVAAIDAGNISADTFTPAPAITAKRAVVKESNPDAAKTATAPGCSTACSSHEPPAPVTQEEPLKPDTDTCTPSRGLREKRSTTDADTRLQPLSSCSSTLSLSERKTTSAEPRLPASCATSRSDCRGSASKTCTPSAPETRSPTPRGVPSSCSNAITTPAASEPSKFETRTFNRDASPSRGFLNTTTLRPSPTLGMNAGKKPACHAESEYDSRRERENSATPSNATLSPTGIHSPSRCCHKRTSAPSKPSAEASSTRTSSFATGPSSRNSTSTSDSASTATASETFS